MQTDGSSVVLPKIADLNNAKVDIIPDLDVNWYVDYNFDHVPQSIGLPVGKPQNYPQDCAQLRYI